MTQVVNFICDTRPTKEELEEAINYCAAHDCISIISYSMFGYMYHDRVTAQDNIDILLEYYNNRTYGM